jgi:hypothetical protein
MKIFLDDIRETPIGFVRTHDPAQTIDLLKNHKVEILSLDHDLGLIDQDGKEITGYDVLLWIEEQVFCNDFVPPDKIVVHSDNASAVQKMNKAIGSIYRLAKRGNNDTQRKGQGV